MTLSWRGWALLVGGFSLVGVFFAGQVWVDYAYAGHPLPWDRALAVAVAEWTLWGLLAPLVLALGRRFPFRSGRWGLALFVHLAASVFLTLAKGVADAAMGPLWTGVARPPFSFLKVYLTLLTYWAILGVGAWLQHYRQARDRDVRASRLEAQLARAQVQALRAQLHPHFLFNTLNTVAGLMREDVEAADVVLARLSELLRLTLEDVDAQEVPVRREMEFIERYVEIQRARFGPRLTVDVQVAPEALDLLVPPMVLQPLVENAMRHGIGAKPGRGRVEIIVRRDGTRLALTVSDDGPGPPALPRDGYGLENTRARLRALYGEDASLELSPAVGGGARSLLVLPARTGAAPPVAEAEMA